MHRNAPKKCLTCQLFPVNSLHHYKCSLRAREVSLSSHENLQHKWVWAFPEMPLICRYSRSKSPSIGFQRQAAAHLAQLLVSLSFQLAFRKSRCLYLKITPSACGFPPTRVVERPRERCILFPALLFTPFVTLGSTDDLAKHLSTYLASLGLCKCLNYLLDQSWSCSVSQ